MMNCGKYLALPHEGAIVGLGEGQLVPRRFTVEGGQLGLGDAVLSEFGGRTLELLPELVRGRLDRQARRCYESTRQQDEELHLHRVPFYVDHR